MFKLVHKRTREQIVVGEVVQDFRGENCTVVNIFEPTTRTGGDGGKVQLRRGTLEALYYPTVIGATFVWDEGDEPLPDEEKELPGRSFDRRMMREKGYDD